MNLPFTLLSSKQLKALEISKTNYQLLTEQTQQAAAFIKQMESGNLQAENLQAYLQNATGQENLLILALISMQQQMQLLAQEEQERKWTSEGLAQFAQFLQDKAKHGTAIFDVLLSSLIKYIGANQGSLFTVNSDGTTRDHHASQGLSSQSTPSLEMVSCYAYERKKHKVKTILAGEGLIGQCFLEAESIFLTDIPEGYVHITSGLGLATPRTLLLVPLKLNEQVLGVIELASFQVFKPYQIRFIEKLGESIASTIADTQVSENTRKLLEHMREQTEELRAAEEEMRQNMEEMAATQEEVRRREAQAQNLLLAFQTVTSSYASIEFDMDGNILEANANFLRTMGYSLDQIKGKHHRTFVDKEYANTDAYNQFWLDLQAGKAFTGEVVRYTQDKTAVWMQVAYAPVRNNTGQYYKVVKLATDVTGQKQLELQAQQQVEELKAQEEELRQNMEELSASQEEINRQSIELQGVSEAIDRTLATIEFTPEGTIVTANDIFLYTMGYTLEQLAGQHHRLFVEEQYGQSESYVRFWQELRQGKAQVGEVKRLSRTQQIVWLSASYTPVLDQSGHVIKVIKFAQDISAQKQKAQDFENQFKAIHSSFSIIEFTPKGQILTANQNFLDLMGYELSEIQGKHHRLFVSAQETEASEYTRFWEKLSQGQFVSGEFTRLDKNGKPIRIKGSYNPIVDVYGQIYRVIKYAQLVG